MTQFRRIACIAVLASAWPVASVAETAASAPAAASARCQVWQRELGFAKSVADHDAVAFAEHLHPRAVVGVERQQPSIGREKIVGEWKGIIDGTAIKLEWYPELVTVGGDGRTAFSTGPALYQDPATGAFRHGRYRSVWQVDEDGAWRLIFDDGNRPEPADAAAVQAFRDGSGKPCAAV
ncbi:MAG: YybH family protein [Pseudoxanthomonas sp.]